MDFITLQEVTQLYPLLVFMILAAFVAVEVKDLVSSVISLGAVGLAVSLAFLMLKAPDLAITQFVVEIIALILLIKAVGGKSLPHSANSAKDYVRLVLVLLFIAIFAYSAYYALKELPPFGKPYMRVADTYIREGMSKTGAANIVASVILDFRGYDTLGEATVLFTAVVGVVVVLRKIGRIRK